MPLIPVQGVIPARSRQRVIPGLTLHIVRALAAKQLIATGPAKQPATDRRRGVIR